MVILSPPAEDFNIFITDEYMKVLHTLSYPLKPLRTGRRKMGRYAQSGYPGTQKVLDRYAFNAHQI